MKITSDSELSVKSIDLEENALDLGDNASDLAVSGDFSLVEVNAHLNTGDADLKVEGNVYLTEGKLESSGGTVRFNTTVQSGSFEFKLGGSILSMGGYYTKTGGSLESSSATLSLHDNTTIDSDAAIDF